MPEIFRPNDKRLHQFGNNPSCLEKMTSTRFISGLSKIVSTHSIDYRPGIIYLDMSIFTSLSFKLHEMQVYMQSDPSSYMLITSLLVGIGISGGIAASSISSEL